MPSRFVGGGAQLTERIGPTWPFSLRVAFASNAALPAAFLAALCFAPKAIPNPIAVAAAAAFVLPLCFLWLASRRSPYAVGVHLLGALGMAFLAWRATAHFGFTPALGVGLLGTLQLVLGFVLLSPDVLIPLLAAEKRHWRKHRRMGMNALCRVRTEDGTERTCVVRNFSRNGILLALVESELPTLVCTLKQSPTLFLSLGSRSALLEIQVRWTSVQEHEGLLGLEVVGRSGLATLFPHRLDREIQLVHKINSFLGVLGKPSLQRLVATLYPLSLVGLLTVTCCGAMDARARTEKSHANAEVQAASATQEAQATHDLDAQKEDLPHVGLLLTYGDGGGFVPAEIEVDIDGCISGFRKTLVLTPHTQATAVRLARNDVGCVAKVARFQENGVDYFPASPFNTRSGESTSFMAQGGGESRSITVGSQVTSPVSGLQSVAFLLSEAVAKRNIALGSLGIPLVGFSAGAVTVPEPDLLLVSLNVRGSPAGNLAVPVTFGGSAREGREYSAPQVPAIIVKPGETVAYLYIRLVPNRAKNPARTLSVTVGGGTRHVVENATTTFTLPDPATGSGGGGNGGGNGGGGNGNGNGGGGKPLK